MEALAYLFSYKETSKDSENRFSVKTYHGMSSNYPKEYEEKKDFDVLIISVGDYSNIYLSLEEAKDIYNSEIKEVLDHSEYYYGVWSEKYSDFLSWDDWIWCWGIEGVRFHSTLSRAAIDEYTLLSLGMTDELGDKLKQYQEKLGQDYDDSLMSISN